MNETKTHNKDGSMAPTIETVSGRFLNVMEPNPDDILIEDIAWALSRISRFCGHTVQKIPYNVGQHSIFVAEMIYEHPVDASLRDGIAESLFGLLHDAAEAYIGDIPSPIKHIPGIRENIDLVENRLLEQIFAKFVGRQPTDDEWRRVKFYDKKAQFIEAGTFMVSRGMGWHDRDKYMISLLEMQSFPQPKPSVEVYERFILQFKEYSSYLSL